MFRSWLTMRGRVVPWTTAGAEGAVGKTAKVEEVEVSRSDPAAPASGLVGREGEGPE